MTTDLDEEKLAPIDAALQIDGPCKEISTQEEKIEQHIHSRIRQLHKAVDEREKELISQLRQITRKKQLSASLGTKDTVKPSVDAKLTFVVAATTTDIKTLCGQLCTPIPTTCRAKLQQEEFSIAGEETDATLEILDSDGQSIKVPVVVCGELVSDITNEKSNVVVTRTQEGRYKLSYKPTIKGRHKLHVKVNHLDIKESPFTVKVKASNTSKQRCKSLCSPIRSYKAMWTAHGIMLNQRNDIIVTHWQDNCVSVITPGAESDMSYSFDTRLNTKSWGIKKPHQFPGHKSEREGEFHHPHQIAQDKDGNFYVTDFFNNRIQKFSSNWEFVKSAGTLNADQLCCPAGVAYNAKNDKLYVVEEGSHHIQVLNTEVELCGIESFGNVGADMYKLRRPWGIAIDSNTGNLYVTDHVNHRIQVFSAKGEYIREIGKDMLQYPVGIAIDTDSHIYVTESMDELVVYGECGQYRIVVFNLEGEFLKTFGGPAELRGVSGVPHERRYRGITVDDCGVV